MSNSNYLPQYMRIYQSVRNDIIDGHFEPGKKLPSIRSFSKQWKVSNITIIKAFEKLKEDELVTTSERSGFFVSPRMQRQVSPKKIGFLSPVPAENLHKMPHIQDAVGHLQLSLRNDGHYLSVHLARWHQSGGIHSYLSPEAISDYGLDAVILLYLYNFHYFSSLTELGIPILALDVDASFLGIDSVFFDNTTASMQMCNALIDEGYSNILFVGGPRPHVLGQQKKVYYDPAAAQREDGCHLAAAAADRNVTIHTAYSQQNRGGGEWVKAANAYLNEHPEVDAVLSESYLKLADKFSHLKQVTFGGPETLKKDNVLATAAVDYADLSEHGLSILKQRFEQPYAPTVRHAVPTQISYAKQLEPVN